MKNIINITKYALLTALFASTVVSCSEDAMDKVNNDLNHTTDVKAKFILADLITSTSFSVVGGDFSTYSSVYMEHEVGVHNQLFNAEKRKNEPTAASTFNNVWGSVYSNLKHARIIIDKCSATGSQPKDSITCGAAFVMAAINSAMIVDMFGDAPWSEAALVNESGLPVFMNPKVDKQKDIYTGVMNYLDQAIIHLRGTNSANGSLGNFDLLYAGNKTSWLKLAYGLKARYTMRLMARSTDVAADMQQVIDNVELSFASADEQAAFNIYSASNLNPLFDFQWSRDGLGASKSMADKLIERNDPRLSRVFIGANWVQVKNSTDKNFFMAPNGANEEKQYHYNTSVFTFAQTAPTMLMSYHELLFLKAEALVRLNRSSEAESVLKQAIAAAIQNTEVAVASAMKAPALIQYGGLSATSAAITAEQVDTYFTQNVKALFDANPLKEAMIQKYIAFFGASGEAVEAYNDYRRLKALNQNFVELKNPNNATKFPARCPYGSDDTVNNPNVQAVYGDGQYVYTEPVWWALGTR